MRTHPRRKVLSVRESGRTGGEAVAKLSRRVRAEATSPAAQLPRGPGEPLSGGVPDARTRKWVVDGGGGDTAGFRSAADLDDLPTASGGGVQTVPSVSLDDVRAATDAEFGVVDNLAPMRMS